MQFAAEGTSVGISTALGTMLAARFSGVASYDEFPMGGSGTLRLSSRLPSDEALRFIDAVRESGTHLEVYIRWSVTEGDPAPDYFLIDWEPLFGVEAVGEVDSNVLVDHAMRLTKALRKKQICVTHGPLDWQWYVSEAITPELTRFAGVETLPVRDPRGADPTPGVRALRSSHAAGRASSATVFTLHPVGMRGTVVLGRYLQGPLILSRTSEELTADLHLSEERWGAFQTRNLIASDRLRQFLLEKTRLRPTAFQAVFTSDQMGDEQTRSIRELYGRLGVPLSDSDVSQLPSLLRTD